MPTTSASHPFSHLGPAPYKYLRCETTEDRQAHNANRQSGGLTYTTNFSSSCDHCGTCIAAAYWFRAADGKKFKVGSVCVDKARKKALYDVAINRALHSIRRAAKVKRHAKEAATIIEAEAWISENKVALADMPHPKGWAGQSLLDQISWTWDNAGTAGKIKTYKVAVKVMAS